MTQMNGTSKYLPTLCQSVALLFVGSSFKLIVSLLEYYVRTARPYRRSYREYVHVVHSCGAFGVNKVVLWYAHTASTVEGVFFFAAPCVRASRKIASSSCVSDRVRPMNAEAPPFVETSGAGISIPRE